MLGNRLGILLLILIEIDFFFRCQKSICNPENNKCACQENFESLPHNWIYLLLNYFSSYVYLKGIHKILKGIGKFQVVSELAILLNL